MSHLKDESQNNHDKEEQSHHGCTDLLKIVLMYVRYYTEVAMLNLEDELQNNHDKEEQSHHGDTDLQEKKVKVLLHCLKEHTTEMWFYKRRK